MNEETPRLGFPLLANGQAQKEVTHNEALVLMDALIQPIVQAVGPSAVPATPQPGQCWIVGNGAGGAWAGHDNAIACWSEGGWRFVPSREGMSAWCLADGLPARRLEDRWVVGQIDAAFIQVDRKQVLGARQPAIPNAAGGAVIDAEVRVTVTAMLTMLRAHGLIAG